MVENIEKEFYETFCNSIDKDDLADYCRYIKDHLTDIDRPEELFLFYPFAVDSKHLQSIYNQAQLMQKILYKAIDEIIMDEKSLEIFHIPYKIAELIKKVFYNKIFIPICRFDGFYSNEIYSFCEFNTDGSTGMRDIDIITEGFLNTRTGNILKKKFKLKEFYITKSLLKAIIDYYHINGGNKERPSIAIVDYLELATLREFKDIKQFFNINGYNCEICDIRELIIVNNRVYHNSFEIDIIYRRATLDDIIRKMEGIDTFLKIYMEKLVPVMGPFKSHIAHSKEIFTILSSKEFQKRLSKEEVEFIEKRVPWTAKLTDELENLDEIIKDKDEYFLKPDNLNSGQGVVCGNDLSNRLWGKTIKDKLTEKDNHFIVQKKLDIPTIDIFSVDNRKKTKKYNINISTYLFNNSPTGFLVRVSDKRVINSDMGAKTLPIIKVDK